MSRPTILVLFLILSVFKLFWRVSSAEIDFSRVWLQHTNQILYIYEQLSKLEQLSNQDHNSSNICLNSMQQLVRDAKNGQFYANKMVDSIGRPTSGILEGRLTYLGQYDECIATIAPSFSGKYCVAHIQLPDNISNILSNISGISSTLYQNLPVKLGVCLPSTCSTEDVSKIAHRFSSMFKPTLSVKVVECMESNDNQFVTKQDNVSLIIFCTLCGVISMLILVGTVFEQFTTFNKKCPSTDLIFNKNSEEKVDYRADAQSIKTRLLLSFSIRQNLKKVFNTDSANHSESIGVFHGIKFFAMIWIIFSHSISFSSQWINFNNPIDIKRMPHNVFSQIIANGTFAVDCFFFISGYLVSHILLKHLKANDNKLNLLMFYLNRYLRMTPTMMIVIGFGSILLRYFGSGPEWTNSTIMFDGWCRKNWWINSLYLHNFIDTNNMCLSHSWYSAVDTQFYLISPLLLLLVNRKPMLGKTLCVLLLLMSIVITWVLTIVNNYPAVPYFNDIVPLNVINSYYQNIYIKPYCRIGPYIVGMLLACALLNNEKKNKISKSYQFVGWTFTIVSTLGVILAMLPANKGNIPDVHIAAAYSATSRIIWSLGLSWITFVSFHEHDNIVTKFLSLPVWVPFSRLTYCAYLIHPILIAIFYGSRHQTFDYSFYLIFYFTLSNICVTYLVSLLVALFIEYPVMSIGKVLFKKS